MMHRHDSIVDSLTERLRHKEWCDNLQDHVEYYTTDRRGRRHVQGEVDVLAQHGDIWLFYEVKVNDSETNFRTARKQYKRFCRTHPDLRVRGIYVTATGIRLMRAYHPETG